MRFGTTCSLPASELLAGESVLHRTAPLLPAHSLALRTVRARALWWLPVLRRAALQQQGTTPDVAHKVSLVSVAVRAHPQLRKLGYSAS